MHFERCKWLVGADQTWQECDWIPSRFIPKTGKEPLQLTGFLTMAVAGSALDSTGWAMWVAVAGVLVGMAMAYAGRGES